MASGDRLSIIVYILVLVGGDQNTIGENVGAKHLLACCGLYCAACPFFQATQKDDIATLEQWLHVYVRLFPAAAKITVDDMRCQGCHSDQQSWFCKHCAIRECTHEKRYSGCHVCDEFPCAIISMMPLAAEKKLILRAVAEWRELGTDAFLQQEEKRYSCPSCHQILSRGATECSHCHSPIVIGS